MRLAGARAVPGAAIEAGPVPGAEAVAGAQLVTVGIPESGVAVAGAVARAAVVAVAVEAAVRALAQAVAAPVGTASSCKHISKWVVATHGTRDEHRQTGEGGEAVRTCVSVSSVRRNRKKTATRGDEVRGMGAGCWTVHARHRQGFLKRALEGVFPRRW